MVSFLNFVLGLIFAIDDSEPIERTWKNFVYIACLTLLCFAIAHGIALLLSGYYVKGIVFVIFPIGILLLWYFIYRKLHQNN